VKLPEALQYAKEAVQEEEAASRDVHLENWILKTSATPVTSLLTGTLWDERTLERAISTKRKRVSLPPFICHKTR
jgi:hypothetical protein